MNAGLREIHRDDPGFTRMVRTLQVIMALFALSLALGLWAVVVNFRQDTAIHTIEHSACQVAPAGKECQRTKVAASKAATVKTTCIAFTKVGYRCPVGTVLQKQQQASQPKGVVPGGGSNPSGPTGPPQGGPPGGTKPPPVTPPTKPPPTEPPVTPPPVKPPASVNVPVVPVQVCTPLITVNCS